MVIRKNGCSIYSQEEWNALRDRAYAKDPIK